jgi:hypothetical protein
MDERKKKTNSADLPAQCAHDGQALPAIVCRPVERPDAALRTVNKPGLAQQLEVMADGWLILLELRCDVADAERLRLLGQQIEQAQARWISQRLQASGKRLRSSGRQAGRDRRGAARLVLVPSGQRSVVGMCLRVHATTIPNPLTFVNGLFRIAVRRRDPPPCSLSREQRA